MFSDDVLSKRFLSQKNLPVTPAVVEMLYDSLTVKYRISSENVYVGSYPRSAYYELLVAE